ncbi:PKD domain-containing protein [Chryseobacterium luquanense]|uniref:PKD/Chitinase domain-containing protein n=1 Tax=Chryseobacterium luquanense TaxID=2983766 RepID=A0ABT3Y4J5_9FLAO|nr:hypothetical protein [Chryseobacterium luquanense]MCX8533042.1 hypothetical protein [Chryseobacterium luquanense]
MNNQLSNISTQYRKFSRGQYIDDTQFNEFLDFFEDQDRLSRVMLQGVGIVCGFKPELLYGDGLLKSIQLSQGVALTTDGDLLTLYNTSQLSKELYISDLKTINIKNKNYTHFKVYDNFKVKYPAFYDGENQIELWELATAEESDFGFQSLNALSNLEDKYLLLYLESYEKEVKPCRGVDCDNHGIQQIRNLKVLMTTAEGINHLLEKDEIQPHPLFAEGVMTPVKQERVVAERLILENGIDRPFSSSSLKEMYSDVLEKNRYGEILFEKINGISQILGIPVANFENFKSKLEAYLSQPAGFQYAYDVVNDLTGTYAEIIKLLPKSFTECFPDLDSFPKHIMLGKLISTIQLDSLRHRFYNSPVLDDEKATQKVKMLMNRFSQQAENFKYPMESEVEDGTPENKRKIRVIPSQKLNPLSNKAIPFYYQVTEEFLKTWNFDKTENRSFRNNLGYNAGSFTSDEHIRNPTSFNIDKNSFYNIEGHQGMSYEDVFEELNQIRNEKQLGFDVMALSLTELADNKDMFKAYFNEYLEKHPGLEHRRGVERGGTFVIVYEVTETGSMVVADFSLPYICCTPKIEVKLSLPTPVICSKYDAIPFTVFPMNGDVEAVVESGLNGGVELRDGQCFFNPAIVDESLYGQEITFTVNGKSTNCSIKVIPQSDMDVDITSVVYQGEDSSDTIVRFRVSGENILDYTYTGDFWDNGVLVSLIPDSRGNFIYTYHDLNPFIIPTIKVNVSRGGCTQTIIISDWYNGPATVINSINFPEGGDCCEGISNKAPVAVATASATTIRLPVESVRLNGESSYDTDGGEIVSYSWKQISPTLPVANITNPNNSTASITGLVEGTYVFELTVTDSNGATGTDTVEIVVLRALPVITANAGGNRSISLPKSFITLNGSGSSSEASTLKYSWSHTEGPMPVMLTDSDKPDLIVTGLDVEGTYKFKLTVQDADSAAYSTDVAEVTVLRAVKIEVIKEQTNVNCEVGMIARVHVPDGESRLIKVFKEGTVPTDPFTNDTGIQGGSQLIVKDGFDEKISATKTYGMFLNVSGFMWGSLTDSTKLILQVIDESGFVYDQVVLTTIHNPVFDSKQTRCIPG